MGVELAPVEAMLDQMHRSLPTSRGHINYTLERMGAHNIVIAVMPEIGNNDAATAAAHLLNDFKSIRFSLLVESRVVCLAAACLWTDENQHRLPSVEFDCPGGPKPGSRSDSSPLSFSSFLTGRDPVDTFREGSGGLGREPGLERRE
ncbi:MAG: hypothetical protein M1839_008893 [Geoglossum umbratile]|nr:MAG: hypothetical protein M1839_008893 [Geoglossum umbratile]